MPKITQENIDENIIANWKNNSEKEKEIKKHIEKRIVEYLEMFKLDIAEAMADIILERKEKND